jgi:hypothetical protein
MQYKQNEIIESSQQPNVLRLDMVYGHKWARPWGQESNPDGALTLINFPPSSQLNRDTN